MYTVRNLASVKYNPDPIISIPERLLIKLLHIYEEITIHSRPWGKRLHVLKMVIIQLRVPGK